MKRLDCFRFSLAIATFAAMPFAALAQPDAWPARPVRIVSFLAPGGLSDTLARILAQHLEARLGGRFLVENRSGGGGVIGAAQVAEQAPDGYTLGISGVGSNVIAPAINANVKFDPMKSFTHIAFLGGAPTALVVHPGSGISSLGEFVGRARWRGGLQFGSAGTGTQGHLIGELFRRDAGVELTHVPYRGAIPVVADVIAGHVPAGFVTISSAAQHVRAGTLKALAVTSAERLAQFPDVPTFAESGYRDIVALTWFALCAPAGLPKTIVTKLNEAAVQIMISPAVTKQLEAEAIQVLKMDPEAFTAFVQAEIERWTPIAKKVAVQPQ
jgi:tripartite-type tricarboxylate transporter receptor subunit TctC